jgi:hypothetical protein
LTKVGSSLMLDIVSFIFDDGVEDWILYPQPAVKVFNLHTIFKGYEVLNWSLNA